MLLVAWSRWGTLSVWKLDFVEQFSHLADRVNRVVYLDDFAGVCGSDFSVLLVRGDVCKLLVLLDLVALLHIPLLDFAFFDFLVELLRYFLRGRADGTS